MEELYILRLPCSPFRALSLVAAEQKRAERSCQIGLFYVCILLHIKMFRGLHYGVSCFRLMFCYRLLKQNIITVSRYEYSDVYYIYFFFMSRHVRNVVHSVYVTLLRTVQRWMWLKNRIT